MRSVRDLTFSNIERTGSKAAHPKSIARSFGSFHDKPCLRRRRSSSCHFISHSTRDASGCIFSLVSSSACRMAATSASACPHSAMMPVVGLSGHSGSPRVSVPYTSAPISYTAARSLTCMIHALVTPPSRSGSSACSVRSCDTVCMADTGSTSAMESSSAARS